MASGVSRTFTGSFTGTGAQIDIKKVGFRPRKVELFNVGAGLSSAVWTESMPDAAMVKRVTAGTMTYPTTNGVTPLADGFRLGADANLNISGQLVHFVCHE